MEISTYIGIMFVILFLFAFFLFIISLFDEEIIPLITYAVTAIIISLLISIFIIEPERFSYTKINKDIVVEEKIE